MVYEPQNICSTLSLSVSLPIYSYIPSILHPSVCPSFNPSSIYLTVCLSIHQSIHPFIHSSLCPSVYFPIPYQSVHLYAHLSIYLSIDPSIHLSIHPSIHPSICSTIDLLIYFFPCYLYSFIFQYQIPQSHRTDITECPHNLNVAIQQNSIWRPVHFQYSCRNDRGKMHHLYL